MTRRRKSRTLFQTKRKIECADDVRPDPEVPDEPPPPRRNFAKWRALSLSLVYVVFAVHIIHWKVTGKTLAPLELNEVMYTLELGIITAGFIFMCLLVFGTLIFGRFFCSWACHIMVLQDACAWLLNKLGIRSKPIRSRLLLFVPPLTALYMFVWPQVVRTWNAGALPTFHFATDKEGWASFVTNNFWRNLPSAPVIVLTFLVCGFAIVYLLGSRTFCTYICPYGAVFGLADRFSSGRIRVSDACEQCGSCTATCTSGIRVHEEVKQHGMIVNPACLKDLDCVAACPQQALSYGLGKPALWKSRRSGGRFGLRYDFTLAEELLMAAVFAVVLLSFRGLYSRVPFLLSLALGAIMAYLTITAVRLLTRPNVSMATLRVKALGKLTGSGGAFVAFFAVTSMFVAHSAFVRYNEYRGLYGVRAVVELTDRDQIASAAAQTLRRLETADRWGLIKNERVERGLLTTAFKIERYDDAVRYAQVVLNRWPGDVWARLKLGQALLQLDRTDDARREFLQVASSADSVAENMYPTVAAADQALGGIEGRRGDFAAAAAHFAEAVKLDPTRAELRADLGGAMAELGQFDEAVASLQEALRIDPTLGRVHYNLGAMLAVKGKWAEAVDSYRLALKELGDDTEVHNNLGFALNQLGDTGAARTHFQLAIDADPNNANAHFNLGRLLLSESRNQEASSHFAKAAALDSRYADLFHAPE